MENTGRAIGRAGDAIDQLSDVPLVGEGFATVAQEIQGIGRETVQNGRSVEDDVDVLEGVVQVEGGVERLRGERQLGVLLQQGTQVLDVRVHAPVRDEPE